MAVTLKQIADRARVTEVTVSNILNGRYDPVRPKAIERAQHIRQIAEELGYRPNGAARAMAQQKSRIIGAVIINTTPRIRSAPFYNQAVYELLVGAEVRLQQAGYVLALVSVADVVGPDTKPSRVVSERLLDGVLAIGRLQDEVAETVSGIAPHTIWAESQVWRDVDCIRRDEVHAGRMVATKLIDAGCKRLLWLADEIGRPETHFSGPQRLEGFAAVCKDRGVAFEKLQLPKSDRKCWSSDQLAAHLRAGVGVAAYDGVFAQWAYQLGLTTGLAWGRDIALACCDDSHTIAEHLPQLSRVGFSRYDLGRQAADMILRRIDQPEQPVESQLQRGQWIEGTTVRHL